jgi:hypothetical protein
MPHRTALPERSATTSCFVPLRQAVADAESRFAQQRPWMPATANGVVEKIETGDRLPTSRIVIQSGVRRIPPFDPLTAKRALTLVHFVVVISRFLVAVQMSF